ncbi:hypothetical protein Dimus_020517 [Dionaea muscipula]
MAATCCAISFCSLSCLLFLSSPSHSYVWATRILPSDSDKVSVELYYESLCPYSASFIINYLATVFQKDELISIIDLRLFPWGNAKINSNSTFDCQHGPSECLLNTIEACAIAAWSDVNKHFPFINCIETLVYKRKFLEWETCFDMLGLDAKPIVECYSSGHGKEQDVEYTGEQERNRIEVFIPSVNSLIKVGRIVPFMVLRVDKVKEYIDLSKRWVSKEDIQAARRCIIRVSGFTPSYAMLTS